MTEKLTTFSELKLRKPLQKSLAREGYENPTPIQAEAIPYVLDGRDLIGCAQTGTGKTAAFALPILDYLDSDRQAAKQHMPRALVLSPTRELAAQIGESFQTYGQFMKFRQAVIFGGVSQLRQTRALSRGIHVLVATPGRLLDLMQQGYVDLGELEIFVLDEADRMLDMGFLPDLKRIIKTLPEDRQSLFFSATMPHKVHQLAKSLLTDPVKVEVSPNSSTVKQIQQKAFIVAKNKKRDLLFHFLEESNFGSAIIFTRTKRGADLLSERLNKRKLKADAIHGNKSQGARQRILNSFKIGKTHILVATDLAARGIDVEGITHVINYDIPQEPENYVHRIGRTGRAGAEGMAVTFCEPGERRALRDIERLIESSIELESLPAFQASSRENAENSEEERKTGPQRRRAPRFREESKPGKKDFRKKSAHGSKSRFGKPDKPRGKKKFKAKRKFRPQAASKDHG